MVLACSMLLKHEVRHIAGMDRLHQQSRLAGADRRYAQHRVSSCSMRSPKLVVKCQGERQTEASASGRPGEAHRAAAACVAAAGMLLLSPVAALAVDLPEPVYFGNGCFWGRQKDFIDVEKSMGRNSDQVTAVVGYAGGREVGPSGKVCYYYADPRTVYERLGHAEVVSVQLDKQQEEAEKEFAEFAKTYFNEFRKTRIGMMRLDPQDAGPGYRNVVGLPGGTSSPLFKILQEANVNNMELREGQGNMYVQGQPVEGDEMNVVWVVDSSKLPFYQAEQYHQFHDGLGKYFPREYTQGLKDVATKRGLIRPTGCPEFPF